MPPRNTTPDDDQAMVLVQPYEKVSAKITEQITKGNEILNRDIQDITSYQSAHDEMIRWRDVTKQTLLALIRPSTVATGFSQSFGARFAPGSLEGRVHNHQRDTQRYVSRLKGILEAVTNVAELRGANTPSESAARNPRKIFVVHGHDDAIRETVARFIERIHLEPIILRERPNAGRTIIEKFEQEAADCAYAIVLMTPDDLITNDGDREEQELRARQNVIYELGYFAGALGRGRVCLLRKGQIEMPSDLAGVTYHRFDDGGWQVNLANEMEAAGIDIDWSRFSQNHPY